MKISSQKLNIYSITISVLDIKIMSNWYEQKIGFRKVSNLHIQIFNSKIQFLELNDFRIELIENSNSRSLERKKPPIHTESQGITNFCFRTKNLEALKKDLMQNNVSIIWSSQNRELKMKMCIVEDPEHNLIQFLEEN